VKEAEGFGGETSGFQLEPERACEYTKRLAEIRERNQAIGDQVFPFLKSER
jgi:hypothetical protein